MKNKILLLSVLVWIIMACGLPKQGKTNPPTQVPPATPTPTTAPTVVPSDLPFVIDCSALPAGRKADCDAFIAATRDQIYPILKDLTGVSLSKCYENVQYIILPTDPAPGAGGISGGNKITYNQAYSIDLIHRYDVHEILHTVSSCGKLLDHHVFNGLVLNYVYDQMGVHDRGYFVDQSSEDLTQNLDMLLSKAKTASGADLQDSCIGIMQRKITLVYFKMGDKATIQQLVQSTIDPPKITTPPNQKLASIWGTYANQIEALLETLKQKYNYNLNVPECGY